MQKCQFLTIVAVTLKVHKSLKLVVKKHKPSWEVNIIGAIILKDESCLKQLVWQVIEHVAMGNTLGAN